MRLKDTFSTPNCPFFLYYPLNSVMQCFCDNFIFLASDCLSFTHLGFQRNSLPCLKSALVDPGTGACMQCRLITRRAQCRKMQRGIFKEIVGKSATCNLAFVGLGVFAKAQTMQHRVSCFGIYEICGVAPAKRQISESVFLPTSKYLRFRFLVSRILAPSILAPFDLASRFFADTYDAS